MIVVIFLIDNVVSGMVFKLDDVIIFMSGKIIEVLNMDVEGCLVLVDGIMYVKKFGVNYFVDVVILIGGVIVVFGNYMIGVMINNEELFE